MCVCCPIEPFFGGVSSVRGVSVKLGSEEFYVYEYSSFALPCRWKVAFIVFFFAYFVRLVVVSLCVMYIEEHLAVAAFGEYHVENNTFQIKRKFNQTSEKV